MSKSVLSNNQNNAAVTKSDGQTAGAFAASLVTSIAIFLIEILLFIIIKDRFSRIYQPRTYLVPPKERTKPPDAGWWKWIKPVLSTSNSEFIQKCGLDAYFFLRYLRMLLKIFFPAACIILPILLPLNAIGGRGSHYAEGQNRLNATNVTGLNQLAWGNISPTHTDRYWAHWLLALALIAWVCYVAFDELRGYIRMRQAYMTSPQHRLRASATTVLVCSIPRKWCTVEALDGLYDVFPGGLRNIWINRNFDELQDKVQKRDKLARTLEAAETALIQKCWKANAKKSAGAEKKAGKSLTKEEKRLKTAAEDEKAARTAHGDGLTSGDPHQVRHTVQEATEGADDEASILEEITAEDAREKPAIPIPILGSGIQAVTQGFGKFGRGIKGGLKNLDKGVSNVIDTTNGFEASEEGREHNTDSRDHLHHGQQSQHFGAARQAQYGGPNEAQSSLPVRPLPNSPFTGEDEWQRSHTSNRPDDDRQPLGQPSPTSTVRPTQADTTTQNQKSGKFGAVKKAIGLGPDNKEAVEYPAAHDETFETDGEDAMWKKFIEAKDRDTMRLPIFGWQWMISLPFVGEKVDTIYYCRKEVARLSLEIEDDQAHPERFPLMNSAFVQFNHQVAAHMACQSLSHHLPKQMAPRIVEIDPNDVIWNNMSIPWWQRYIRTFAVATIVAGMVILWIFPVVFTASLSQITAVANEYSWLHWLLRAPTVILNIIQGVLPATLLAILMFLLPVTLRLLATLQGTQSGMLVELLVQKYYFFFLFVQLFLVVSIASAATALLGIFQNINTISDVPNLLAQNIPRASNYFFSYMLLQALSVSAGALVQVGSLISWFVLAPLFDSTARDKFKRQTALSEIQWGTFFPVYTNLACIGLIYSVIAPLILVFNIITFSLFWFVYRYQTLYVTKFTRDTGGLLFPNAINCTFTGLYVMEACLAAMFFLVRNAEGDVACLGQAIGMVVILFLTAIYQILLNKAFSPLFRYLPITLEDDAVRRDEEFARAMSKKHEIIEGEEEDTNLQDELEMRERQSKEDDRNAEEYEMRRIESDKRRRQELPELEPYEIQNPEIVMNHDDESRGYRLFRKTAQKTADATFNKLPVSSLQVRSLSKKRKSWADRSNNRRPSYSQHTDDEDTRVPTSDSFSTVSGHHHNPGTRDKSPPRRVLDQLNNINPLLGRPKDIEAQRVARGKLADALFAGVSDELEDLTPEQRDTLVQRAFQHIALRARRPVIWIPRDELGVSDDEVRRMGAFSKNLWVSNVRQGLDSKGKSVYSGAPPDFSEVDLIQL
jgi:calcium permeable stress-gated cation channel